jgi:hypothetical protein
VEECCKKPCTIKELYTYCDWKSNS